MEDVLETVDGLLLGEREMVNPVIGGGGRSQGVVRAHLYFIISIYLVVVHKI